MATHAEPLKKPRKRIDIRPTNFDRTIAALSGLMLIVVTAALLRGAAHWNQVGAVVWYHILTIWLALALTPPILLRRRGDRNHRLIGYVWVIAMVTTALSSFWIREINSGRFSPIHILSAFTLVTVPLIVRAARRGDHAGHRQGIRLVILGALLTAGFFTFFPGRMLSRWLIG